MSMNIIAGYRGEAHITSQQDRNTNIGIFGSGVHILNIGSKMAATVISANEVQIADGLMVAEGCTAEIPRGTTESMTIENGAQDMLRKDLIVARYTRNSGTGVEGMALVVIKGTPAASNPALPSYTTGSIADGDTTVDFPLYTVNLDGITIDSITSMVDEVELSKKAVVDALAGTVNNLVTKIGNVVMGTTATTITGAIKELLTKINTLTSNLTTTNNNVTAVEYKTNGIVSSATYNIAANAKDYKQLAALGMYMIILNGASTSNAVRGIYLVGVTSGNTLGIKAISAATGATVDDVGNGIVRVTNSNSLTMRYTLIRMY